MPDDDAPKKSDIDFDELDKAVNSLMGKVGGETLEDSDKTKLLDIKSTLDDGEKPKYTALSKVAETIGNEMLVTDSEVELVEDLTKLPDEMNLPSAEAKPEEKEETPKAEEPAAPVPKPAVKRPNSGRFMDMVNSKADMRTAPPLPNLIVPTRSGVVTASAPTPSPVVALTTDKPEEVAMPEPALSTPFLSDAKVQKRPLGGAASTAGSITVNSGEQKPVEEMKPDEPAVEPEDEEPIVETEPINSEGGKNSDDGSGDEQRALNAVDFEKVTPIDEALTKIEATEAAEPVVQEPQTIEKVESGDTEGLKEPKKDHHKQAVVPAAALDGGIYNTTEYHQPISHAKKQKSGWGTVVIILIIIVLAVAIAGGAYLYFGAK